MQQVRRWHWISSALCLVTLVAFAATGFTLNHASMIKAEPRVVTRHAEAPPTVLAALAKEPEEGKAALPPPARDWARRALGVDVGGRPAEWSPDEAFIDLPRPGGEATLSIARQTGRAEYEKTSRGLLALLNDLHKGRNAGPAWGLFIDVFAASCLVFALTGLVLLHLHSANRRSTWPLVGAGFAIPALIAVLFLHL